MPTRGVIVTVAEMNMSTRVHILPAFHLVLNPLGKVWILFSLSN